MRTMVVLLAMLGLASCAGVSITPISGEQAKQAHTTKAGMSGYIVYEPMIVVQLSAAQACVKTDGSGNCTSMEHRCSLSSPMLFPDYSKPFVIDIKNGFGKAGADITINDGWRLAGVKDNSDNTAILGFLEKALGLPKAEATPAAAGKSACDPLEPGIYRWLPDQTPTLKKVQILKN